MLFQKNILGTVDGLGEMKYNAKAQKQDTSIQGR
jgi:hypothetical protein